MKASRRNFIKYAAMLGIGMTGNPVSAKSESRFLPPAPTISSVDDENNSLIGIYGKWAAGLNDNVLPRCSFRNERFKDLNSWKKEVMPKVLDRINPPTIPAKPVVQVRRSYVHDGLAIDELSWQLPFGTPTQALLLRPAEIKGKLPGVLALHDHSGNKFFGWEKITKTQDPQHPLMIQHQTKMYSGRAWANDLARSGYAVLVPDTFTFGSRRIEIGTVPEHMRKGYEDLDYSRIEDIFSYNVWAGQHEHIIAKCLFSAGTTWPGVFLSEDQAALDVLCDFKFVDKTRIGCCGLSVGGLRANFLTGLDDRIKCSVSVGFMTNWNDLVLQKAYIHTWMAYVPILPNELDFPEILSLGMPKPMLVLNSTEDPLFTLSEMHKADDLLKTLFRKAGDPEKYKCLFFPGEHKFDNEMQKNAFQWFDRWLKV